MWEDGERIGTVFPNICSYKIERIFFHDRLYAIIKKIPSLTSQTLIFHDLLISYDTVSKRLNIHPKLIDGSFLEQTKQLSEIALRIM